PGRGGARALAGRGAAPRAGDRRRGDAGRPAPHRRRGSRRLAGGGPALAGAAPSGRARAAGRGHLGLRLRGAHGAHAVHRALLLRTPRLPPAPALAPPEHAPPLVRRPPLPRARALRHRVRGPRHPRGVAAAAGHRRGARLADPLDAAGPAPALRGLHPGGGGAGAGVALRPPVALAMSSALNLAVALLLSPLMLGVITRVKARFAGRRGAPLLQPYLDLVKLFRKG